MRKVLIVSHVSGFVPQFEMNNVRLLQEMGCEVHYASNFHNPSYGDDNRRLEGTGIICHQVDFVRTPYSLKNIRAYGQLRRLMEEHDFALVHCHNPMSAALTRLAARATHTAPVIYTAHGFHFYQGAPLHMWFIYGTMEWLLSFLTCEQICINKEDYAFAKKHFHCRRVDYVPGVGIDIEKIRGTAGANEESAEVAARYDGEGRRNPENIISSAVKRQQMHIPEDAFVIVTAGELIPRKNQAVLLQMMKLLKKSEKIEEKRSILLICGHGELDQELKRLAMELGVQDRVRFLGYRDDLYDIYRASDVFAFPSLQEGMPAALMEAMACGLPAVCSDIRGSSELIDQGKGGYRAARKDVEEYARYVRRIRAKTALADTMGYYNQNKAEKYSQRHIIPRMAGIYEYWMSFHNA